MSLQSDFELCLEYAKAIETEHEQRIQAQNNIIFVQNESERLKKKLRICIKLSVLSAAIISLFLFMIIKLGIENVGGLFSIVILFTGMLVISLYQAIKTKRESDEFEVKKFVLIQKYTADAENCKQAMIRLVKEIHREGLLDIIPEDYFSVEAIEFCLNQVRKKIARTATEAFQQLEAEIRRLEQMELLEQIHDARIEELNSIKRAIDLNTFITLMDQNDRRS